MFSGKLMMLFDVRSTWKVKIYIIYCLSMYRFRRKLSLFCGFHSVNNMSNFFESQLTEVERNKFTAIFETKTTNENHCIVWTGQQKKGYGVYETRFRGKKIKILVHRLRYFISNNCQKLRKDMNISHLCHNKLCVKISHLCLEPQSINNKRQICKNNGECSFHYGYPKCLI